jgi:hypothetical protein
LIKFGIRVGKINLVAKEIDPRLIDLRDGEIINIVGGDHSTTLLITCDISQSALLLQSILMAYAAKLSSDIILHRTFIKNRNEIQLQLN